MNTPDSDMNKYHLRSGASHRYCVTHNTIVPQGETMKHQTKAVWTAPVLEEIEISETASKGGSSAENSGQSSKRAPPAS